jgi:hypothetical protein
MPEFFRLAKRGREAAGTGLLDEIVHASEDGLTTNNNAVVGGSFRWFANAFILITEISSGTRRPDQKTPTLLQSQLHRSTRLEPKLLHFASSICAAK